jgi:isopenicillin-N epimerase
MNTARDVRSHFLLDPSVTFLNHGSFGACPRPVFERYQQVQRELELQPVDFLTRRLPELMEQARAALAAYVGAEAARLAFVPNSTTAINIAARAIGLQAGDEVLATDEEYGACDLAWEFVCTRAGARYIRLPVGELASRIDTRTRAVFVSHITSRTGLLFPIEAIIARGRAAGAATIIDGAHAPGQVPLQLDALGADFYAGNCHKWLCAPKGSGFLYVGEAWCDRVDGAIVSWGYSGEQSSMIARTEQQGTRDPAAYLSVPAAIDFVRAYDDRDRCVSLARAVRAELCTLFGVEPISPEEMVLRMASVRAPDAQTLVRRLWEEHRIEVPATGTEMIRISIAMYTDRDDIDKLLSALRR